jgi:hypothetical protein
MSKRLLNRQISLLDHLASSAVIFGDKVDTPAVLQGIDSGLMQLEARFCYDKRIGKIAFILPRTFQLLDRRAGAICREFVDKYPPVHIGRIENARQFRNFLIDFPRALQPPHISDTAACELACAEVRIFEGPQSEFAVGPQTWREIRRSPGTILLRCSYDVRQLFENDRPQGELSAAPPQRETLLMVARSPDTMDPQIYEVSAPVFSLATGLDDWTDLLSLNLTPGAMALITHLGNFGLIEAR